MAFKSLAGLLAIALLALAPVQETTALSLPGGAHLNLISRMPHSSLVRRQKANGGKRCRKRGNSNLRTSSSSTASSSSSTPPKSTSTRTTEREDPPKTSTTNTPRPTQETTPNYKRGMIFTQKFSGFLQKANDAVDGKIWGTYNWGPNKPQEAVDAGVPFIPTLWGYKTLGDWGQVDRGYARAAFGPNEVNQDGQSTMSPSEGVRLWEEHMRPLIAQGYKLYSPSVSNAPSGFDWYDQYFKLCPRCKEETAALNLHYYSNKPDGMIAYLEEAHERYGLPIIVSEFGCANWSGRGAIDEDCDEAGVINFIQKTTDWMNSKSYIISYFYFGFFPESDPSGGVPKKNALYTEGGGLTAAGRAYLY